MSPSMCFARTIVIFFVAQPVHSHLRTASGAPLRNSSAVKPNDISFRTNQSRAGNETHPAHNAKGGGNGTVELSSDQDANGGGTQAFSDDDETSTLLSQIQQLTNATREGTESLVLETQTAIANSVSTLFRCFRDNVTSPSSIFKAFGLNREASERAETYLGSLAQSEKDVIVKVNHLETAPRCCSTQAMKLSSFPCSSINSYDGPTQVYGSDFCNIIGFAKRSSSFSDVFGKPVLFSFGDKAGSCPKPTFVKTRKLENGIAGMTTNSILLDIAHSRHWGNLVHIPSSDIPFSGKTEKLVWRGVSTGKCDAAKNNTRMMFVTKYFKSDSRIDVGISRVVQRCQAAESYLKGDMSIREQLKAKYIMVVNGNDKASGLNWVLASNSVPFMTRPTIESWLRESSLRAGEHYVEIEPDFSDLVQKLDWAIANPSAAERIAEAGQGYIRQFADVDTEANINGAVLTAYLTRVQVEVGAEGGSNSCDP